MGSSCKLFYLFGNLEVSLVIEGSFRPSYMVPSQKVKVGLYLWKKELLTLVNLIISSFFAEFDVTDPFFFHLPYQKHADILSMHPRRPFRQRTSFLFLTNSVGG